MFKNQNEFFGFDVVMFFGIVEDRNDPLRVGRVKVRCFGWHSEDKSELPTSALPWAQVLTPVNNAAMSGIGNSPTGLVEGTMVMGVFMDGKGGQMPLVLGSVPGIASQAAGQNDKGFQDPNGKYPLETNIPDTPKLAYDPTNDISTAKASILEQLGLSAQKSQYPYNHASYTESGHAIEKDDTPGNERLSAYHKSGTFIEILPDGTQVNHIVKDNYQIIAGDDTVTIKGFVNIIVSEDATLHVEKNLVQTVGGNYDLTVSGTMTINNDVTIVGISHATDHDSDGISGHNHTHADTKGLGAGTTTPPQ